MYPADLKSLIYGKDLTGEVNKISYYYNIPASYVYTIFMLYNCLISQMIDAMLMFSANGARKV